MQLRIAGPARAMPELRCDEPSAGEAASAPGGRILDMGLTVVGASTDEAGLSLNQRHRLGYRPFTGLDRPAAWTSGSPNA